jgi:hypothetical protein
MLCPEAPPGVESTCATNSDFRLDFVNTRTVVLYSLRHTCSIVDARTTGSFALYHVFFEARFDGAQSHWKVARDCLAFLQTTIELHR